ncbi:hypothetical protein PHISCL_01044 [Aspergillus sclerotialis]|uniref:Uncharacterized protein n=1 Tax=Aspergillus sclerotialis TaxID=2070753 RepID=A0A3A2ZV82_9EURO|nr:hypothetical protein PHISCL_01044 [Aspergillus sclerotialis]
MAEGTIRVLDYTPANRFLAGQFAGLSLNSASSLIPCSWNEYSYGLLIGTLAMVEDPRQTPITSSLPTITGHLRASAGPWFWVRGAFYFLSYRMVTNGNIISLLPDINNSNWLIKSVVGLLVGGLFANWQVTWVHAIISQPLPKSFFEHFLRFRLRGATLSVLAMHMTLHSAAFKYSGRLEGILMRYFDIRFNPQDPYQLFAAALFPCTVQCVISVAVRALFVRIAASTLPADEPSIIHLDPSLYNDQSVGIAEVWSTLRSPAVARALGILKTQFTISIAITLLGEMVRPGFHKDINFPLIWFLKPVSDNVEILTNWWAG